MSERITAFLAVRIPAPVSAELERFAGRLGALDPAVRPVRADGFHLTLAFLGTVGRERLESVREAAAQAASGSVPFTVGLAGLGCFPAHGRPQVVWMGVERGAGGLASLAAALLATLRQTGWDLEDRAFRAHCTLARVTRALPPSARHQLTEPVLPAPHQSPLAFVADRICLMGSLPVAGGPNRYPSLGEWRLGVTA